MAVSALVAGGTAVAGGCTLVLGFDDTTLRSSSLDDGGPSEGGTGSETGPRLDAGQSRITTTPSSLVLRRGGSTNLTIDIVRGTDVTGIVTARLTDLPAGVTATSATFAPPATNGVVTLSAMSNALLGAKTITLSADGANFPPASIPLLVAEPAGALDTTFDGDGLVSDSTKGLGATFFALAVQTDQKIVAGGAGGPGGGPAPSGWMIRRFTTAGAPDAAFDAAANTAASMPGDGSLRAIALDPTGKIVCVGQSVQTAVQTVTVVRLLPSGQLDATFGGGVVRVGPGEGPGGSIGLGVVIQPDGAIVVVGSRKDLLGAESAIVTRFTAAGARDATFNGGASVAIPNARFVGVALEAGAVVAAGSTLGGALPSYLATRRTAQGANDPTFGTSGIATFGSTYRANAFARLADGSIAVVGDVQQGAAGYTAGVATPKGVSVFARGYSNSAGAGFFGLGVQADGRLIAAGHTAVAKGEARIERILADGKKDTSFADGGTVFIEPAGGVPNSDATLFAAAVELDGRILAAGNRTTVGAVIYRLWP